MVRVFIGTSGWQYRSWRGLFYPQNLPQKDWFRYYSKYFDSVEVNSTFYRQTKASTFEKWQEQTPRGFVFSIKGHRFITHIKRLKDVEEPVKLFFEHARVLKRKKHVILWQLPPSLKKDTKRLGSFLSLIENLPKTRTVFRHAFEFRHSSWVGPEVSAILQRRSKVEATGVLQDWKDWPIAKKPVGKFVYIRLHGRKALYHSDYSKKELKSWAGKIKGWQKRGLDVYAYFNNDALGYAVPNAKILKELVE